MGPSGNSHQSGRVGLESHGASIVENKGLIARTWMKTSQIGVARRDQPRNRASSDIVCCRFRIRWLGGVVEIRKEIEHARTLMEVASVVSLRRGKTNADERQPVSGRTDDVCQA